MGGWVGGWVGGGWRVEGRVARVGRGGSPLTWKQVCAIPIDFATRCAAVSTADEGCVYVCIGGRSKGREGEEVGRRYAYGLLLAWKQVCAIPIDFATRCAAVSTADESAPWATVRWAQRFRFEPERAQTCMSWTPSTEGMAQSWAWGTGKGRMLKEGRERAQTCMSWTQRTEGMAQC
jgi:hypothetical protein